MVPIRILKQLIKKHDKLTGILMLVIPALALSTHLVGFLTVLKVIVEAIGVLIVFAWLLIALFLIFYEK